MLRTVASYGADGDASGARSVSAKVGALSTISFNLIRNVDALLNPDRKIPVLLKGTYLFDVPLAGLRLAASSAGSPE